MTGELSPSGVHEAHRLWAGLVLYIAARRSMRLYVAATGKYDDSSSNILLRELPERPAAVPVFRDQRTNLLVLDFDLPKSLDPAAAAAAVERDVERAIELLRQCGARWIVDRSPLSGMHILVPLAPGEWVSRRWLRPLLDRLKAELPCLDLMPMLNPERGCITVPGSRTKHGGFRQLVGATLDEAVTVFKQRSRPGLIGRLNGVLDPGAYLSTRTSSAATTAVGADVDVDQGLDPHRALDAAVGPGVDDRLPASIVTRAPLRDWVSEFCATGTVPGYRSPDGSEWTPSHAREAVLFAHAARGWSLAMVKATAADPAWEAFWAAYRNRNDRAHRLATDWRKAFEHARTIRKRAVEKSSSSAHKVTTHTGGSEKAAPAWYKLAAARKWILTGELFRGVQRYSALAVIEALAFAQELTGEGTVGMGIRWLSDASGCSEATVTTILKKFRDADGSPIERAKLWTVTGRRGTEYMVRGDGYKLVEARLDGTRVQASEWEARMARPARIAPVWRQLGLSAWWIHTVLTAVQRDTASSMRRAELAAAARVSAATVDRAVDALSEIGLVTAGHGWVTATERGAYEIPELSAAAAADREIRLDRQRRERAEFQEFLALIEANYTDREIQGYANEFDVAADHEDYMQSVAPGSTPPTPPAPEPDDVVAQGLLADLLGAVEITDQTSTPVLSPRSRPGPNLQPT